jgi:serine/threonine-protein kinase HipA
VSYGSISGAQRKGLFALQKNELRIASAESTFILKPDGDYPELPANEHLTMTAARRLGFDVPQTGLVQIEKVGLVFVIRRFDRTSENRKLLVEDMAQIYEEASQDKYSLSHEKVGQAISEHT